MSVSVKWGIMPPAPPSAEKSQSFMHTWGLVSGCHIGGIRHLSALGLINAVVAGFVNLPSQGHIANSLEETPEFVSLVTLGSSGLWASSCPSVKWGVDPRLLPL